MWSIALPVPQDYPTKNGKPTRKGIEQYIEDNSASILIEYQNFIKDTLYNVWFYTEDLTDYLANDPLELGWYYPNEIYITTSELFIAYELADLSKVHKALISESNKFVKSTVIHELTHNYIHQISIEMRSVDKISVHRSFQTNLWILTSQESFGRSFIEEGLCEYISEKMGELIPSKRPYIPGTVEDLIDKNNSYNVKYKYSTHFLKPFLDTKDFKKAVKIILHNAPPSYMEILDPERYFDRLVWPL
ncbi:MAG: hypothetical protein ABFS28_07115 [Bacteroidota bacterium]